MQVRCITSRTFPPGSKTPFHVTMALPMQSAGPAMQQSRVLQHEDGKELAYDRYSPRDGNHLPAMLLLNGLLSDKTGRKANEIRQLAVRMGCEAVLFDYQAHGESPGDFTSLGPRDWLHDAQLVMDRIVTTKRVVVIGSSLGGWLALHLARSRPARTHALLLIAPAVDISELHWSGLTPEVKRASLQSGLVPLHSPYVSTPLTASQTAPQTAPEQHTRPTSHSMSDSSSHDTCGAKSLTLATQIAMGTARENVVQAAMPWAVMSEGTAGKCGRETENVMQAATVSQQPGDVMLGLSFFIQGSQLLCMSGRSLFAEEYATWQAERATGASAVTSTTTANIVAAATAADPPRAAKNTTATDFAFCPSFAPVTVTDATTITSNINASATAAITAAAAAAADPAPAASATTTAAATSMHAALATVPIQIIHGDEDDCVPLSVSLKLMQQLCSRNGGELGERGHGNWQQEEEAPEPCSNNRVPRLVQELMQSVIGLCYSQGVTHGTGETDCMYHLVSGTANVGGETAEEQESMQGPHQNQCNTSGEAGHRANASGTSRPGTVGAETGAGERILRAYRELYVVKGGDHRLSSPAELCLFVQQLESLLMNP